MVKAFLRANIGLFNQKAVGCFQAYFIAEPTTDVYIAILHVDENPNV